PGGKPGADRDVAGAGPDELEETAQLGDGVLAVRVDPAAVRVVVLVRVPVSGRDRLAQAAVVVEADDLGSPAPGDPCRSVGGAVVDDENVRRGQAAGELIQHCGKVRLLVPSRKEDERVGHAATRAPAKARRSRMKSASSASDACTFSSSNVRQASRT